MEENNVEVYDLEPIEETEIEESNNSTALAGAIGLGIGVAGTLLAKKGWNAIKRFNAKRKAAKEAQEFEDVVDVEAKAVSTKPEDSEEESE